MALTKASNPSLASDFIYFNGVQVKLGDTLNTTLSGIVNSPALAFTNGQLIATNDATVNGLTVGRGTGNAATNTAFGANALRASQGGANNTSIGASSGQLITTGGGNTTVGSQAGSAITTGSNNVVIGAYTGAAAPISATGSNFVVFSDGAANIRGYFDATGNLNIRTSNAGLIFNNSSALVNSTLNDYETGTWTPSLGGTATYTTNTGSYVKVGRLVYITFQINISAIGTGSTTVLSGLPFTVENTAVAFSKAGSVSFFTGLATSVVTLFARPILNTTTMDFPGLTAAATAVTNPVTVFTTNTQLIASAVYQATF